MCVWIVCVLDDSTPHRQPHWINVKLGLTWFDQPKSSFQTGIEHDWTKKPADLTKKHWDCTSKHGACTNQRGRLPGILISPAVSDLSPTNCYGIYCDLPYLTSQDLGILVGCGFGWCFTTDAWWVCMSEIVLGPDWWSEDEATIPGLPTPWKMHMFFNVCVYVCN